MTDTLAAYEQARSCYLGAIRKHRSHADILQFMRAETEAWRAHFGPALKAADEARKARREAVSQALARIENEDDRKLLTEAIRGL